MATSELLGTPAATLVLEPVNPAVPSTRQLPQRVYDIGRGRCAVEIVLAPAGITAWRVRLNPVSIRLVVQPDGQSTLTAHVSARPRYANIPGTGGLFMSATERSTILGFSATMPRIEAGVAVPVEGVVRRGYDEWPADLTLRVLSIDEDRVVATFRGSVARRDDLPLPKLQLGIDAALELGRCE